MMICFHAMVDRRITFSLISSLNLCHYVEQKMKCFIKDFFSKCDQIQKKLRPQKTARLVTFTKEILNGKLYFLCSVIISK